MSYYTTDLRLAVTKAGALVLVQGHVHRDSLPFLFIKYLYTAFQAVARFPLAV